MRGIATLAAIAAVALAGCYDDAHPSVSAPSSYRDYEPFAASIKADDPYATFIKVATEPGERGGAEVGAIETYGLYATIDKKTGSVVRYVQWSEVYSDRNWRFYSSAATNRGEALSFKEVDRSVNSCSPALGTCIYTEVYNIMMPAGVLADAAKNGLNFKVTGRRGDVRVLHISARTVQQFNDEVASAEKRRATKS